ncbi:S41 family peptidase [Natranaerobius thermophilus]|uniref:Peptidase S41 n=1 Tax=Natranaerobius thermophilus (strain ATCC BAA-1301 / DSM 18059 / JW/NM-WN-LF) TaxID=457570 RepID=B2A3E1_NATTJ|nr:S41 family peptidase [Natranaerobius thermophilus]ACB86370.1 peptidase S41 [Natranaerobius thermophilus JW/NM-WN-LF]
MAGFNKKTFLNYSLFIFAVLIALMIFIPEAYSASPGPEKLEENIDANPLIPDLTKEEELREKLVEEAVEILETYYVEEPPHDIQDAESLEELFEILDDPYTMYLSEKEKEEFAEYSGDPVNGKVIADSLGYIQIKEFSENSSEDFKQVIIELLEEDIQGWVVNLRGNPGGTVEDAGKILGHFVGEQDIVVAENYREQIICGSKATEPQLEKPAVFLVDRRSASAAEMFAYAIKNQNRGLVIGEKTFGKGTVQNLFPLSEGGGLLTTIYEVKTLDGKTIEGKGIEPHFDLTDIAIKTEILKTTKRSLIKDVLSDN